MPAGVTSASTGALSGALRRREGSRGKAVWTAYPQRAWDLWFVRDLDDLLAKHDAASRWLREELRRFDVEAIPL